MFDLQTTLTLVGLLIALPTCLVTLLPVRLGSPYQI